MSKKLEDRPGYETEAPQTNALARDLGQLAKRHGLLGCVLISFTDDMRVGTNFSAKTDEMFRAMDELSSKVLTAIDDGKFDPTCHLN